MASRRIAAHFNAVATDSREAFLYPPTWIGMPNSVSNTGKVPRHTSPNVLISSHEQMNEPSFPGNMKSKSDHNSVSLFWTGEPVMISRWRVRSCMALPRSALFPQTRGYLFDDKSYVCVWILNFMTFIQNDISPFLGKQIAFINSQMLICGDQKTICAPHCRLNDLLVRESTCFQLRSSQPTLAESCTRCTANAVMQYTSPQPGIPCPNLVQPMAKESHWTQYQRWSIQITGM